MAKVLGIGGIFFKSPDPGRLGKWYAQHLGLSLADESGTYAILSPQTMPPNSYTVWSTFDSASDYFAPSSKESMFNLVVDNIEEAIDQVKAGGAQVIGDIQSFEYGRFGWFMDPDGNKVELWEPSR